MYNLRYHLASLVSVFLALAIGVILGGLIVDNSPAFDTDKIIRDLQAEYDQLRGENESLQARTDALEEFSGAMVIDDQASALSGRSIAILSTDSAVSDHALDAVADAGATPIVISIDSSKVDEGSMSADLRAALSDMGVTMGDDGLSSIAAALVTEWTSSEATSTPVTAALIEAGALNVDGVDGVETTIPSLAGLVNAASLDEDADPLGIEISAAFLASGSPAVGVSMVGGSGAVAAASWDAGVSGIDTLGSALGRHSIVALMLGADQGLYGLMDGASAAFAAIPSPVQP